MEAYVVEEIKHQDREDWSIDVLEPIKGKGSGNYRIIGLCAGGSTAYLTPKELRQLGKWLVSQGKDIGKRYKGNGKLKA